MNGIVVGHHVRARTALDRAIRQGRSPHAGAPDARSVRVGVGVRVERSESLDEREASAKINDVMAFHDLAVR
jgi:hypothetical protein